MVSLRRLAFGGQVEAAWSSSRSWCLTLVVEEHEKPGATTNCHTVPWPFTTKPSMYITQISSAIRVSTCINMYQLSSTILLSYSALALYRYHPCILPKYHQLSGYQHVSTCINYHRLSCCHTVPWPFTDTIHVYYPNIISYQGINMYQHVSTIIDYPVVIQCLGPLPIPSMYITQI